MKDDRSLRLASSSSSTSSSSFMQRGENRDFRSLGFYTVYYGLTQDGSDRWKFIYYLVWRNSISIVMKNQVSYFYYLKERNAYKKEEEEEKKIGKIGSSLSIRYRKFYPENRK